MSEVGGILLIVGIVVTLVILGFVLHGLFHRFGRSRPESGTSTPHPPGRVGRTSEFREES